MTRRQLFAFCAAAFAALKWPRWTYAQDRQYERAVTAGFNRFAGVTAARARIAPVDEPGLPLRIRGTLYRPDGTTPSRICSHTGRGARTALHGAVCHRGVLAG